MEGVPVFVFWSLVPLRSAKKPTAGVYPQHFVGLEPGNWRALRPHFGRLFGTCYLAIFTTLRLLKYIIVFDCKPQGLV